MNKMTTILCLILALCLGVLLWHLAHQNAEKAEASPTRYVQLPDGRKVPVPADARVRVRYVKRDTTQLAGHGGVYDSFRDGDGEFQPGGPARFDLSQGTLSQHASAFSIALGKTSFSQVFILGAAAVIGGLIAFAIAKEKRYLWVSAGGAALIVLGYFLQEYGGWLFIIAVGAGTIWFLFGTHAGKKLRDALGLQKATLQAVATGVENTEEKDPASAAAVKGNIAKAMKASPASTDAMDALVDEAKS
jgi:hypothetical protein